MLAYVETLAFFLIVKLFLEGLFSFLDGPMTAYPQSAPHMGSAASIIKTTGMIMLTTCLSAFLG